MRASSFRSFSFATSLLFFGVAVTTNVYSGLTFQSTFFLMCGREESLNTQLVQYGDSIYKNEDCDGKKEGCDGAPVVDESHKLIFFTSAKVGRKTWKMLLRRMAGHSDWATEDLQQNPETNGLKYLYDYDRETASAMLESDEWTKALFVREPKSRFLSAYLDKAVVNEGAFVRSACCPNGGSCVQLARTSFQDFLNLVRDCDNEYCTLVCTASMN